MEYITLQNSNLNVSRICIGGCPMGGYGWGHVEEDELIAAVKTAIEKGINFFDTADTYGLGKSEETLGKAIGKERHNVIIATKFGVRIQNDQTCYDNSPLWIETALHKSLERLDTDYIDLYQIHYRDTTPIENVMDTLFKLQKKGYIRYIGLSNIHRDSLSELKPYLDHITSFQDEYSLACRKNEKDIIDISNELHITPMTWGSLGQGVLTGKYGENVSFGTDDRRSRQIYTNFHGEKLKKNLEIVATLKEISARNGHSVPAIAIRFILDFLSKSIVLVGVKRPTQVISNLEALNWSLTEEQMNTLIKVSEDKGDSFEHSL